MADVDVAGVVVMSWLLTYAIHSTILLAGAAAIAWRLADQHAWLDAIWKAALIGPLVTASLNVGPNTIGLTDRVAQHTSTSRPANHAAVDRASVASAAELSEKREEGVALANIESTGWQLVMPPWPSIAVLAWLLIAAVLVVRYGATLRRFYRSVGSGPAVPTPELQPRIKVTTSDLCTVPLALAGRHIVVPPRFLVELTADEQRAALAHETAHVLRRDPAWRIIAAIVERVLFFQPLNRAARIRMTESAEFLCDRWAVQQTGSPLALARCLSMVAAWASPADDKWAIGVSAMARSDSAMVRRVKHILHEPLIARRPRVVWLIGALAVVAVAAPRVTATPLPITAAQMPAVQPASAAAIAQAQANLRVYRPARPTDSLEDRWRWALAEAGRQRFSNFWIAYSFETPVHAQGLVVSDSDGTSFVSSEGRLDWSGPSLSEVLRDGGGNIVVLMHHRGAGDNAIDRVIYRSASLGFDFERTPLFWLGYADEAQSFDRVRRVFEQARVPRIQRRLIDLASIHGNSNVVIPFLTQLVDVSQPSAIRTEAAEGFGNQHDPRSVEVLSRVARTDPLSQVRVEAAEAIGDVQTPQAIPALAELVDRSDDPAVRREAAEAIGEQPAAEAVPALERVIASSTDENVINEAIEALGDIEGADVLGVLVQTVNTHPNRRAQQEAVETLGDIDHPGVVDALARIISEHPDERIRREAIDTIADAVSETGDARLLDRAEQTLERAIFDDANTSVRMEALDAVEKLPRDRAFRMYQNVIDRHPDARVRREAVEQLRDRRQF